MVSSLETVAPLTPGKTRFYGWRLVLVGAFILAIAGDGSRRPKIARAMLGDPLADGPGVAAVIIG